MGADDGYPIHYSAVARGTPVYAVDGQQVGTVEVARTAERAVRLTIDSAAAAQLPAPEKAAPNFTPRRSGRLGKLLGGNWRRR